MSVGSTSKGRRMKVERMSETEQEKKKLQVNLQNPRIGRLTIYSFILHMEKLRPRKGT